MPAGSCLHGRLLWFEAVAVVPERHVSLPQLLSMTLALPPLSPWQQYVWDHGKLHWMLFGGRRKGKSYVCSRKGVHYCVNGKHTAWYCASRALADENWDEVVRFCEPFATRVNRASLGIMEFETPNAVGTFKRKSGWGNSGAGRAGTLDFAIFDEAQLLKKSLFNRVVPSLVTRRGHIAMTLTAPETPEEFKDAQWIRDALDTADEKGMSRDPRWKNWLLMQSPTMPEDIAFFMQQVDLNDGIKHQWKYYLKLGEEALDEDRALLGEEDFLREYMLKWSLDTSRLVYDNVIDGIHRNESNVLDPNLPVRWSCDRGEGLGASVIGMFQVWQHSVLKRHITAEQIEEIPIYAYRFFDEVSTTRVVDEDEMINEALTYSQEQKYPSPEWVFYDVRAPGYRKAILSAGLRPYSCSVPIEDGIRNVRRTINKRLFGVHPKCKLLWRNLADPVKGYIRDDKGEPVDGNNDAADMCRYAIYMSEKLSGSLNSVAQENQEIVTEIEQEDTQAALLPL